MRAVRTTLPLGLLALAGCFYSSEAGKNLETRVDKLDKDLRAEQKAQQEKLDEQQSRIDQKIAQVSKALDSLDEASRRSGADASVQLQKVIEDLAQLRGQVEAYTHSVDALQDRATAAKGSPPAADVPRPTDKKEFFALAQSKAKAGDIPAARSLYTEFVRKWPKDDLAGDAHFALAESYYGQDNCPEALPEYGQLIKNFGKSRSVPLAYVRSGDCFARLKNPEAARLAYEQVLSDYPKSSEAKLAQKGLAALKKPPPAKGKK
ncbi:MAG: tetratricopeptide repeat protein [Myxococcaceae bacterium]